MGNKYFILTVLFFVLAFAKAQSIQDIIPNIEEPQKEITDTLGRDYDNRMINERSFERDMSENYAGPDFDYIDVQDDSENFLKGFFNGIFDFLRSTFGIEVSYFWKKFIEYTVYVIMAAFAIYFLVRVLSKESASALIGRSKNTPVYVNVEESHIEDIDLEGLIKESIASGNYRQAIRYMYLETLKILSSTGRIEWDQQKTNGDYLREIKNTTTRSKFQKISYLYDHIWYGEFELDTQSFKEAQAQFNSIKVRV
ncbi:MAG: DUF4129 domain-containing protein [Nonlabens sp.]